MHTHSIDAGKSSVGAVAFDADILARVASHLFTWRQGPGLVGGFHLHSCWGESSVLTRGYHGSSTPHTSGFLETALQLAKGRDGMRWRRWADDLAAQLLWQQLPTGGFFHASAEMEPTYTSEQSCPIHQMLPVLALLDYYEITELKDPIRGEIERCLKRHLVWFQRHWWKLGNGWRRPLEFAGWCGVTNQDLVAVAALARYAEVLGDWGPFKNHGLPALETYLGSLYYHEDSGLFERGDSKDSTEKCGYMSLIIRMLNRIHAIAPHPRIPGVVANVSRVLADAIYLAENGEYHVAFGVDDAASRKEGKRVWSRKNRQIPEYCEFLRVLAGTQTPSGITGLEEKLDGLEKTILRHVSADATLPTSLDPANPLFAIVPSLTALMSWFRYLAEQNPEGISFPDQLHAAHVLRTCGELSFESFTEGWIIRKGGEILYRGIKRLPYGVLASTATQPNYPFPVPSEPLMASESVDLVGQAIPS